MIDLVAYRISIGTFANSHAGKEARLAGMFPSVKHKLITILPILLLAISAASADVLFYKSNIYRDTNAIRTRWKNDHFSVLLVTEATQDTIVCYVINELVRK